VYLPACSKPEQAAKNAGPVKQVTANAWLRIGTDGSITVLCDRSEMGQGVYTALPTLIAEELGVAPSSVKVEFAPPGKEYINNLLGGQVTGGSTSVRDAWEKLRMAGAEARMRLISAAAKDWGAPPQSCSVADGYVVFTEPPQIVRRARGSGGSAAEARERATQDSQRVQVHRQAATAPGYAVQGRRHCAVRHRRALAGHAVRGVGSAAGARRQRQEFQGRCRARHAGREAGAADVFRRRGDCRLVVASEAGRDALQVEWTPGKNAKLTNAAISAGLRSAASGKGKEVRKDGDVEAALKSGRHFEATYELPLLAHATMEPQNCTAEFRDDGCHIYVPTQVQQIAQGAAAQAAGLPPEKVFVHTTFLGGGFGRRLEGDFIPAAVECAKAVNKR
jgi:isoquinoline 1-oxidoreductase beta subunit